MEGFMTKISSFQKSSYKPSPTGYLLLNFDHGPMTVIGGPFDAFEGGIGVCLETKSYKAADADITLAIPDFTAPSRKDLETTLAQIVLAHEQHPEKPVFVGCKGGFGRTGTLVAALAKLSLNIDGESAVAYTRTRFNTSAVETEAQENVVEAFDPTEVWANVAMLRIKNEVVKALPAPAEAPRGNAFLDFYKAGIDFFLAPFR
jgi:hypothetical protein